MRIVIAVDKFKDSLSASAVSERLAAGIRTVDPRIIIDLVAVADGGEGTLEAALRSGFSRVPVTASGPTGEPTHTAIAVRGTDAVVEMALASGLDRLSAGVPVPLTASSRGTGELVRAALDLGCEHVVLGVGGSACTDGGAGLLRALGVRFLDAHGRELADGGAALTDLDRVDVSGLDPRVAQTRITLGSDVDNPLLGPRGAAAVFAPQKGASPQDVLLLENGLARLVSVLARDTAGESGTTGQGAPEVRALAGAAGAGAAGGVGFAALAFLGATRVPGAEVVQGFTGLADRLVGADLVVTGEGSLDAQSLGGKAPLGVAAAARRAGVPVVAVCGVCTLDDTALVLAGLDRTFRLSDLEPDPARSMVAAGDLLERVGVEIAHHAANRTPFDLVVRGRSVLAASGTAALEVGIRDGRVVAIEPLGHGLVGAEIVELADSESLLPGLVDTHVHVNEPGRTEWEGFASATRAAAAGGVTTIIDMPLNSIPPTLDVPALEVKRGAAERQAFVDVGFWGGAVPENRGRLEPLHDAGVYGFKCFLVHSGVEEFGHLEGDQLAEHLAALSAMDALLLVHAEDTHEIERAPAPGGPHYATFLASRPRDAEDAAIAEVIETARTTGGRVHILHLSSADALPMIARAKRDGVRITVETCPHYLTLTAEEVPDGGTAFKCCPPIREAANRDLLWAGLEDGTIDCIVSDHSPSTLDLKDLDGGDFAVAWGGVSSLQLGLALVWTQAQSRGLPLEQVVAWMSTRPAQIAGLARKGGIAIGQDADLAVVAPDDTFVVDATRLHHKNPITPYAGRTLRGVVRATYLRGRHVDLVEPTGRLLRRGED